MPKVILNILRRLRAYDEVVVGQGKPFAVINV